MTAQNRTGGLITTVRVLMGAIYLINGINWWFKIIAPFPSISDFVSIPPPPDVVGAMIENGVLFHLVKATEVLTGLALLTNRFVPLMLVAALPVTVPIFIVDVFFIAHLRGIILGGGSLLLNGFLLLAYLGHFNPLLAVRGRPGVALDGEAVTTPDSLAPCLMRALRPIMPALGWFSIIIGFIMLGWLFVMMAQYIAHPISFHDVHKKAVHQSVAPQS